MKPVLMRLDVKSLELKPGEVLPRWAEILIESYNDLVDAVSDTAKPETKERKTIDLLTVSPVEASFPLRIRFPRPPKGLRVLDCRNLTDPLDIAAGVPDITDFQLVSGGVDIRFISGIVELTRYRLTIEATYE